jgi:hypothetical protein
MVTFNSTNRFKILVMAFPSTNAAFRPVIILSKPMPTESTFIASAMNTGQQPRKRSRLMCTESFMFLNQRYRRIRWRLRVRLQAFLPIRKGSRGRNENPRESPGANISPVKKLFELLAQVRDEQSYIVMRERTHRNTAESTNGRVKWWSIFQLGVLLGEGIFQVWWLKRFFEVSR